MLSILGARIIYSLHFRVDSYEKVSLINSITEYKFLNKLGWIVSSYRTVESESYRDYESVFIIPGTSVDTNRKRNA